MRKASVLFTLILLFSEVFYGGPHRLQAHQNEPFRSGKGRRGAADLALTLQELTNPFSLFCVAAHVGDVDYSALAYYRYKLGARVGVIFATRDESGGDAATDLQNETRGINQTRAALKACNAVGADAYFLNLKDFGYAKTADEVFARWGKEEALKRMIEAIRRLRPDCMITSYVGKSGDGYQQATGQLLVTAFDAAADSNSTATGDFEVWQTKRLYQKTDFGNSDTFLNLLETNRLLGGAFSQFDLLADLSKPDRRDTEKSFYKLALSATGEKPAFGAPFFEGLRLSEKLTKSLSPPLVQGRAAKDALSPDGPLIEALVEKLIEKRAEGSVGTLRERYGADFFRVVRYTETLERALAMALGVDFEIRLSDSLVAQGEPLIAQMIFRNGSNQPVSMVFHILESLPSQNQQAEFRRPEARTVAPYTEATETVRYETSRESALTMPQAQHLYDEQFYPASLLQLSQEPFGRSLQAYVEINLERTTVFLPALQKYDIAAPVEMTLNPPFAAVKDPAQAQEVTFILRVRNRLRGALQGALWIVPLALSNDAYEPLPIRFAREDEETTVQLSLTLPILKSSPSPTILIEFRRERPAPPDPLAAIKIPVKTMDISVAENLKVGYLASPNSPLPPALALLGVERTALTVADISTAQHGLSANTLRNQLCGDLSRFDTILVDALVYSANPDVLAKNSCLLDYARHGGNLVVLYQHAEFWDYAFHRSLFPPYSLALSDDHLTEASSAVKILNPEHQLMSRPNRLSEKDFDGWTRNRAFYLPKHWATDYEALLEAADAGEEARKGLLLMARYETGSFVYSSLDLSKPLAEGNAGAYRLLANLISLAKYLKG